MITTDRAIAEVRKAFPFPNYFGSNDAPWRTVGDVLRRYCKPGDRLLDFGSGACDKTAIAAHLGLICTAVDDLQDDWYQRGDTAARIERFASDSGIAFRRSLEALESRSLDVVMMNDVLEHIHASPRDLLFSLVDGLKEGGLFFATVPNLGNLRKRIDLMRGRTNLLDYDLYFWHPGHFRGPQREYVRGDLVAMFRNLGLEIVELRGVHHMLQKLPWVARPAYRALTTLIPGAKDSWLLVARKPVGWEMPTQDARNRFVEVYKKVAKTALYDETSSVGP